LSATGTDITARIGQRTQQLLQAAAPLCRSYGAPIPDPVIRFDLRGQAAGQVQWRSGEPPLLRYNLAIARGHEADFLATTVTHEVAHLVTVACHGRTRPHGAEWRAVMAYLGVPKPQRCHRYDVDGHGVRRQRRWAYRCKCREHELSTTRHNRAQAGQRDYLCRACGSKLRPVEQALRGMLD
jgi:SprT protein